MLKRLEGVEAFIPMKTNGLQGVRSLFAREEYLSAVAPAQWRDKDEDLYMPVGHVQPTSPSLIIYFAGTSLPAPRHATTTRC